MRSYRLEDDTDIIITGSNSKMLSSELSTLTGGRYQEIYAQSLSYQEFIQFHGLTESDDTLWQYLNYGGISLLNLCREKGEKYNYVSSI